jgi:hypothetical protein
MGEFKIIQTIDIYAFYKCRDIICYGEHLIVQYKNKKEKDKHSANQGHIKVYHIPIKTVTKSITETT